MSVRLTADLLLRAYASGIFPMAEARDSPEVHWIDPRRRGIIPLDRFHVSRSLRRRLLRGGFAIRMNHDFPAVLEACADRDETWINAKIAALYLDLHRMGRAHSVEVWIDGTLAGGIFGVTLAAAFFGESMFSRRTDASKIALAYLVDRLRQGRFTLFDTQFLTPHLARLGAIEVNRAEYRRRLADALARDAEFDPAAPLPIAQEVVQRITQTS